MPARRSRSRKILIMGRKHWDHAGYDQNARRVFLRAVQCKTPNVSVHHRLGIGQTIPLPRDCWTVNITLVCGEALARRISNRNLPQVVGAAATP